MPNLLIIWALSVALHLLRTLEVVGTGNAILYHLTSWHYLAVLVLLAAYFRSSHYRVPRVLLGLILCVEVTLVTAIEFDLSSLLMLLTFSTLAYHYLGPGITARKIMVIGGGIVVLFPISGIAERVQAGHSLPEVLSQGTLGTFWGLQRFLGRMIGTDALTMIVAWTPEPVRFQGGETLLFAIYGLIPRAIWSGKPSIIMCAANNRYFSGRGADANTCAAMTVPGELYWNFGALGILIGLFAIGLLLGLVYRWFKNGNGGPRNYALLVVYSLVLLQIMRFESGFGQVVSNLVKGLGFAAIFLWLVTEPRGGGAFIFDGKSAFERSQVYKVSRSLSSTFSPSSSVVYSGSKQWYRWAKKLPQKSATTLESCQLVSSASSISQRLSVIWFELRTTLCKAWETSGVQSILESSRTYRLVKRLH